MDMKKSGKRLRKLWLVSLESSFVFHAGLWCLLPCPLSPWEAFGLLSSYRIFIVYRFIVIVIEITIFFRFDKTKIIERYIESSLRYPRLTATLRAGPALRLSFALKAFSRTFGYIWSPILAAVLLSLQRIYRRQKNGIGVDFVEKTHAQQMKSHIMEVCR